MHHTIQTSFPRPALKLHVAALLLSAACAAHAQQAPEDATWTLSLGAGVADIPRYEGSDEHKVRAIPLIRGSYRSSIGKFSLGSENGAPGLAWSIIDTPQLEAGLSLGMDRGRKESDSSHLQGLGNVNRSPEAGIFGVYKIGAASLRLSARTALNDNGHGGSLINAGAGYRWQLADHLGLSTNAGFTWASTDYMQSYFGVSASQSAQSGLARYDAKSGIKDINAGLGLDYMLNLHWMLVGGYRFARLQGDAADSPIVQRRNQHSVFAGASYRW
ncbi:MipA/OmpV family protein [Uliginosibacterium gangwonense]|uniref:MipA/OmpV family protein n=1 Tax=Uliginosibacterium gangwonense TaxID=392736 RepID=UPI00036F29A5|nr:MipA/OmpV family protein [Uliginosibacterium gangwonense]